ncbi:MAG: Gx transporter family protein, partial [Clostridia bacterium]|nr:Gx transporter family protein [Clostridia bacterium]
VTAGIMSLSGGILSAAAMFVLLRYGNKIFGLMGISVTSALFHNIGQLIAAAFITGTSSIVYYAPALAVFGIATGAVTGVIFKAVIPALDKFKKHFFI